MVKNGETVTFVVNHPEATDTPLFELTTKAEFLTVCPDPENYHKQPGEVMDNWRKLFTDLKLMEYLHNPNGPAFVHLATKRPGGYVEYYLNGKKLTPDEASSIIHNSNFKKKVNEVLREESAS